MNKIILDLLNPVNWLNAYKFHNNNKKFDKSTYDLELHFYSNVLKTNMLHYGFFNDTEIRGADISISMIEEAQLNYANKILEAVTDKLSPTLDVGCGMGGLSQLLHLNGFDSVALTPNKNQIQFIGEKFPHLTKHCTKYEKFSTDLKFGSIINSESLQYINLDLAFKKSDEILKKGGRWIIIDYFRTSKKGKSGHILSDFQKKIEENGWKIIQERDITLNILPTLKFIKLYSDRLLQPLKHFIFEKIRYKYAWIFFLTKKIRKKLEKKLNKEVSQIDPEKFLIGKKYMFFVLEKKEN